MMNKPRRPKPYAATLYFPRADVYSQLHIWARSEHEAHTRLLSTFKDVQLVGRLKAIKHTRGMSPS